MAYLIVLNTNGLITIKFILKTVLLIVNGNMFYPNGFLELMFMLIMIIDIMLVLLLLS